MVDPAAKLAQVIAAALILAELFLSLAALTGLFIVQRRLVKQGPYAPINARFLFAIRATMMLFAGRALMVLTGGAWFKFLVLIGAALIPLAVLFLTEGLLRRHAPKPIKMIVAGGTALFLLFSVAPAAWVDPARLAGLLVFQVASLVACGVMVWSRDQTALSPSENMTAVRLGLSLILLIPLCASDYLLFWVGLPIQLSAVGVLVMCWLATSLYGPATKQTATVKELVALMAAAGLASVGLAVIIDAGVRGYIISLVVVMAAVLLGSIAVAARGHRRNLDLDTLRDGIAKAQRATPVAFLQSIRTVSGLETAAIVTPAQTVDLDPAIMSQIFAKHPLVRADDTPALQPDAAETIAHLFAQTGASHLMQIRSQPLQLISLNLPSLTQSPTTQTALEMLQAEAILIAQGHSK